MEIKGFTTKFAVEDVVWLMYNNKPTRGIVYAVNYSKREVADISTNEKSKSIIKKIKSFFSTHNIEERLWYDVQLVKGDDGYGGVGMFGHCDDTTLFHTKEELLKAL